MTSSKKKAEMARKVTLKGVSIQKARKVYTIPRFTRPDTLKLPRKPKYVKRAVKLNKTLDSYDIIRFPLNTEAAMREIEDRNTLVFICDIRSSKSQIKNAFQELYGVKPIKVNTLVRMEGDKKAFIRLGPDTEALEVAGKIGFI